MASNEVIPFRVGVVLPAAGCGERMKLPTPKQFCEVNGRPLICYTIDCFHRVSWVQQIVISTSTEHLQLLKELTARYGFDKVTVVEGGTTRHRSISAGVKALQQVDPSIDVVVIHDAVRPFVSTDVLQNIAVAAHAHGAAGVCRPLVSTVIARDAEQRLTESLDRSQYFNSEMPQAFQVPVIAKAYSKCSSEDFDFGTECLLLAMKYSGVQACILDGSPDLWKVTYKKDLFAAEAVLKERLTRVGIVNKECWLELADAIASQLSAQQIQVVEQVRPEAGASDVSSVSRVANTFVLLQSLPLDPSSCRDIPHHSSHATNPAIGSSADSGDCVQGITNSLASSARKDENVSVFDKNEANFVNGLTDSVGWQTDRLLERLKRAQSEVMSSSDSSSCQRQLVDLTFVHVFVACSLAEGMKQQTDLSRTLLRLSKELQEKEVLVFGVLASRETSVSEVSEMVSCVIHRGHRSFSGQLFLVA